jgi:nitroreductase
MKKLSSLFILATMIASTPTLFAKEIKLPAVDLKKGKSLMECFSLRKTSRHFSSRPISSQVTSEILYAADGINREDGRKTVPTARNTQGQTIYVATAKGVWLYLPKTHSMKLVMNKDIRKHCGTQSFHAKAPIVLIFVANLSKIGKDRAEQLLYAGNHVGYSSQNVYLYAASQNMATVVCGLVDKPNLGKILNLPKNCEVIFTQPIGYPGK